MRADGTNDDWRPVLDAYREVRPRLPKGSVRTEAAFRYHLRKRNTNGLAAADAVRVSPLGRLLVSPDRFVAWAISERSEKAA